VKPAKSATLLVSEEEVPKLHLAATRGKITLAMRGEDERISENPASANMGDVLAALGIGKKKPKATAKPPGGKSVFDAEPEHEPRHSVLVYHGSTIGNTPAEVEQITFEHARSSTIVDVETGLPTRASATLRSSKGARRSQRPHSGSRTGRSDKED
jgi:hypothetical protein